MAINKEKQILFINNYKLMKKHLLMLFAALMAVTMSLKAQTIVIDDGFENGIQDSVWTQEYVVGSTPWGVESVDDNLAWPSTVWQGSKRAYLRNTTGETQGYVTRLVSKVMDLSPDKVYQPQLTFWYANPKWTADRDTLRVLYKTGANADWKQLAEYSSASASWQKVTLELPEVNATYQIAFEGKDNLGRGIVLDSVKLRSAPECTVPYNISTTNNGNGKVTIAWNASWDAEAYELIVATDSIDPDTVASIPDSLEIVVLHEEVSGLSQSYEAQLTSGAYYYVYLRSLCVSENSAWNSEDPEQGGAFYFRVNATKYLPYSENFNRSYSAGIIQRDLEWTWGTNATTYTPHLTTNLNTVEAAKYSPDATVCLAFNGQYTVSSSSTTAKDLAAGTYAYVATPGLADSTVTNFTLSTCQVRFWSTVYQATGRTNAHSIIVGVMTDPEDFTTFVPVDTVSVWGTSTFVESIVDLSSYSGEGTYVAFASNFELTNQFYIDNVVIEQKPSLAKVTEIYVNPRDTYAEISWEGSASSYNVLVTNAEVDPSSPKAENIVAQTVATTNSYTCEGLTADTHWDTPYYVYVQAIGTDTVAEWSYRYPFVTIAGIQELPMYYSMEQAAGSYYMNGIANTFYPSTIGIFSNDPEYPHLYTTNPYKGNSCLYLTKDPGNDSWITLPLVDSIQDKQMTFYLSGNNTPAQTHATVGVMTNPMDINTFVPVRDFTISSGYARCFVNFSTYTGENGVIAIVWTDVDGLSKNTINYIDELTIETLSSCLPPSAMEVETEDKSAVLSWEVSNQTEWEMIVSTASISDYEFETSLAKVKEATTTLINDTLTWSDVTKAPSFDIEDLTAATTYYIYVRALCSETEQSWWSGVSFTTECSEAYDLPYTFNFDGQGTGTAARPLCWTGEYSFSRSSATSTTVYPYLSTTSHSGSASLYMYSYHYTNSTTGVVSDYGSMIVAPKMNSDVNEMRVEFWAYASNKNYELYVGTVSSPTDSNFVGVDTIKVSKTSTWEKFVVDFTSYTGSNEYVAFKTHNGQSTNTFYVDDVTFKSVRCTEAYNIDAENVDVNEMDIVWGGKLDEGSNWEVKVLNKYAKLDTKTNTIAAYDTAQVAVVNDTILSANKLHVDGLKALTKYFIYVRPLCGDSIWAVDSLKTGCQRINPLKANKETFEQYIDNVTTSATTSTKPDCYTGLNANSATATYIPYLYKSATFANSGEVSYKMYATAKYGPAWIASPEIACDSMTNLLVSFTYYASTSYMVVYGVMTDPEDLSTFVALDSINGLGSVARAQLDMNLYKDSIPEDARYFAWRTPYGKLATVYLDDISIIEQTCPVTNPSYSELESESVRISSGLRTDDEWVLLITTKALEADSLDSPTFTYPDSIVVYRDTLSSRSKVVTGLTEQTQYYVATVTVCDTILSAWSTTSFLTPCKPVSPEALGTITFSKEEGYETGSSGYLPCWTVGSKTEGASKSYIPYVNTSTTYQHNGYNYLYIYTYISSSSNNDGAYAIMPILDVDSIKDYQVNFYARSSTTTSHNNQLIVGIITDPSDLNTFVVIDTLTLSKSEYEAFTVSFEDYEGDYLGNFGKYIMFLGEFGVTNSAYVSEISVEKRPTCPRVAEILVDSITSSAAVLSWDGEGIQYRLLVSEQELADDSTKLAYTGYVVDSLVSNGDSVWVTDLDPATRYYAYVQPICAVGDTGSISLAYAVFNTDCPSEEGFKAPYITNFDNNSATGTKNRPDCWTGVQLTKDTVGPTQSYPCVNSSTTNSYSQNNYLYMYSYGTSSVNYKSYAVAPKVQGSLNDYMVSFYARQSSSTTSYGNKLLVGYVTDPTEGGIDSTFVTLDTVELGGTTYGYYEVNLTTIGVTIPSGAYVALKADYSIQGLSSTSKYSHFYVDNFRIGLPPTCYAPTLEAGVSTLTTAEVTITPAKEGNDLWELAVIPDSVYQNISDIKNYLDTVSTLVTADSTNFVVSGLSAGTIYQVYARTVCGGEDGRSAWTDNALQVITQYYYEDSYFFGFEKSEPWIRCPLATNDDYYMHPALQIGYDSVGATTISYSYNPYSVENTSSYIYSYTGDGAMRLYAYKSSSSNYYGAYVIFPAIDEAQARSFEFKIRPGYASKSTGKISTTYASKVQVGLVDKGAGIETFKPLATYSLPILDKTTAASESNNYFFTNITVDLDSATMADKQVVLYQPEAVANYAHNYIDDATLSASKGYSSVAIEKIAVSSNQLTVNWANVGGTYNLYVTTPNTEDKSKTDTVASYEGISATSQVVTGLQPQTEYTVILNSAAAPSGSNYLVSASETVKTYCLPLDPDANGEFVWDFDDEDEWEQSDIVPGSALDSLYKKPECFTVGTTYGSPSSYPQYNWLIQRKGFQYTSSAAASTLNTYKYAEYGRNDSKALRVYTTSTYMTPYIVLPELNCSFDTMMIEFYGRCFANYANDHTTTSYQNKIISTDYLGSKYCQSIVVGTLTDPGDFSTLEVIDTLSYKQTNLTSSTKVTEDETGLRYWEKMQLPLAEAKGKYIVLFQPAYGLFFLDDLSIKAVGDNIFAPSNESTDSIGTNDAYLSWSVKHPTLSSVVVVLNEDGTAEILRDTIVGTSYHVTGLDAATQYQWYMYQTNGTANSSETARLSFYTECLPITPDYTTGFEFEEGWRVIEGKSDTYKQTKCWTYGNAGTTAVTTAYSYLYNQAATKTASYAHSGEYAARVYAFSTSYQTYLASPEMDPTAYDTLQVNFWMRPGYHNPSTSQITTQYTLGTNATTAEYYYAKAVIVGTMTDPEDPTTFVPIDTVNYVGTFAKGDEASAANDYLFQKKKVSLQGATGPYVAFMSTLYAKGAENKSTYDQVWLDDISFSLIQTCNEPTDLTVSDITASEANLSWTASEYNEKYVLQVSTDPYFAEDTAFVYNDTVEATSYALSALQSNTTYTWRVRSICGEEYGDSEFSSNSSFNTSRVPFFLEDFRETTLDAGWSFGTTPAIEVIDSTDVEITGANNTSYGFKRITNSYGIYGAHYVTPFYSSSTVSTTTYDHYWMISPAIYLEEGKNVHLTLDMALTASSISSPTADAATADNVADDFTFMIAVSDDGGKTWKKENILALWNDTIASASPILSIPAEAENMRYDLSSYAGKNVKIAFYRDAETYLSKTSAVHIGNIRVSYFDKLAVDTTSCQYEDIEAYGFYVDGDTVTAGIYTELRVDQAEEIDALAGAIDTVYTLTAEIYEAPETILSDTICEGDSYTSVDFTAKTVAGKYRRKLQSVQSCDSIITLYLAVTPRAYAEDDVQTLCPGEVYTWNGVEYNRAGIYRDTTVSAAGCDSIQTLVLSFYAAEDSIFDASDIDLEDLPFTYQNETHPYIVGQAPIYYPEGTPVGVYQDTVLVAGENCTAVLVHTLTITDKHEGIDNIDVNAQSARKILYRDNMYIICNDKWYNAAGQKVNDPRK